MQFKGKLKNQTSENGEKPNFGPNFGPNLPPPILFFRVFFPILDARHYHMLSYSISRKTYDPNSRKWQKTSY